MGGVADGGDDVEVELFTDALLNLLVNAKLNLTSIVNAKWPIAKYIEMCPVIWERFVVGFH